MKPGRPPIAPLLPIAIDRDFGRSRFQSSFGQDTPLPAVEKGRKSNRPTGVPNRQLREGSCPPLHRIEDGINGCRVFIPKCWFDAEKCARGIDALKLYRSDYDETLRVLRPGPVHDCTSHAADAFRYLAMTIDRRTAATGFNRRLVYPRIGVA